MDIALAVKGVMVLWEMGKALKKTPGEMADDIAAEQQKLIAQGKSKAEAIDIVSERYETELDVEIDKLGEDLSES